MSDKTKLKPAATDDTLTSLRNSKYHTWNPFPRVHFCREVVCVKTIALVASFFSEVLKNLFFCCCCFWPK